MRKGFGFQKFFALATTAIFKRCNTQAYQNFFKSTQGNRKGKSIRPPKFKRKMLWLIARFTKGGFKVGQLMVYLARIEKLKITWSRELPPIPL